MNDRRVRGASSIELLICLAITALLFSSALQTVGTTRRNLARSAQSLSRFIEHRALLALTAEQTVSIVFRSYPPLARSAGSSMLPPASLRLPKNVTLEQAVFGSALTSPSLSTNVLQLHPNGVLSPGRIELSNTANERCAVLIGLRGRVRVRCY